MSDISGRFSFLTKNLSHWVILLVIIVYSATNFSHRNWNEVPPDQRGVINWDIISYYSYLPATFIYGDVSLEFVDEPGFNNDNKFWYIKTDDGKKLILTSMGLSYMYAPFFFTAHALAPVFDEERDGFGSIYQFFIVFSSLFYLVIALIFLRKLLLRFFNPVTTGISLLLLYLGSNLYYYGTYEAAMSHSYNFSLIAVFIYLIVNWLEKPTPGLSILMGFIYGIIVLIRPSNVLILLLLIFWGITNFQTFKDRVVFFLGNYLKILLMIIAFLIPWIPQFLYWHTLTGSFIYNAYDEVGSAFFFDAPKILDLLFSYRKGWFLYVPIMFLGIAGMIPLYRRLRSAFYMCVIYMTVMIYLLASWWSWWYGGSFGPRGLIDTYAVMVFPLAALVDVSFSWKKYYRYTLYLVFAFCIYYNFLQVYQYRNNGLHYIGTTKIIYWKNFLQWNSRPGYWENISFPDFELARKGIYYYYRTGDKFEKLKSMEIKEARDSVTTEIKSNRRVMKDIRNYARRNDVSPEEALNMVTERVLFQKREGDPY